MRSLSIAVHGDSGTGKSWLSATAPAPRCILDAEGGSRFAPAYRKVYWDPTQYAPPEYDGTWDTCIVKVTDWSIVEKAMVFFQSGVHPFKSVVLDSLTEMQKRIIDQTSGINAPTSPEWGVILRVTEDAVRKLRDLRDHPTNPIECLVIICLSQEHNGKTRPFVRGQLQLTLPGFVDVVGYMALQMVPDGINPMGSIVRTMTIAPLGGIDAKDRTHILTQTWGQVMQDPNLETMIQVIDQATGGN